jgi:hypothetical protein
MDASYHGDNLRMALDELEGGRSRSGEGLRPQKDPATGEAAPMGSRPRSKGT